MPSSTAAGLYYQLADYLTQTRQLLRDNNGSLYTTADLTYFINTALRQRDLDLGLNRVRYSFTLTSGVFQYTFASIIATGTVLTGLAGSILQDVLSIIVLPIGSSPGSSVRYPLARWPYSKLAYLLSTSYPTYPAAYALYGSSTIMFGPPPAANYITEMDFIAYSPDMVNPTDQDIMPYPFSDPVPYQAARLAKVQAQRGDEAKVFNEVYNERLNRVRARARAISISNPFSDLPGAKR